MCLREHIDGLYFDYFISIVEEAEVACLCGWIATYVNDALGMGMENGVDNIGVHTCAWRVGDDDIGGSVLLDEISSEDVLHVASKEERVVELVDGGIDFCVFNGFGNIFNTDDFCSLFCYEVGNGSGSGVEVIDVLFTCESCKIASYLVEFVGLLGVGLVKTLGTNFEAEVFHCFVDVVRAVEGDNVKVVEGVVTFCVVHIE